MTETTLRAIVVSARMEMKLPFDAELQRAVDRAEAQYAEAEAVMPGWDKPLKRWPDHNPAYQAFLDRQDWAAIRAEFARKAKKIGLTADHDISMFYRKDFCELSCVAKGAA